MEPICTLFYIMEWNYRSIEGNVRTKQNKVRIVITRLKTKKVARVDGRIKYALLIITIKQKGQAILKSISKCL